MSAVAVLKKAHDLWGQGKLQDMANLWGKNGTIRMSAKVWPEINRIFTGPAGVLDWIALIHKRSVFHDAHFEDFTESADKSVANCSLTNYTTDSSTGKKQMNKMSQQCRIDTETGLIKSFTMSVTTPDETFGTTTFYGCVRSETKLKKGARQAVGQKLEEILPECYRIEGYVAGTGYFKDDETYIGFAIYDTVEKAHASKSDPAFSRLFAEFGDHITGHTTSVNDAYWAEGYMSSQGKTFATVSMVHLKQGARNVLFAPNDMFGQTLKLPGFIGLLDVIHNDNLIEAVGLYNTEEHAKGAIELAKPMMAEMMNYFAAPPEPKIYPTYSISGINGSIGLITQTFADAESKQAWIDLARHEEGESNLLFWSTGELSMRVVSCYSSSQYAKVVARYKSNPELERVLAGITKSTGFYTGATGAAEAIIAGWNALPQVSIDYVRPLHSNVKTANISADGAFIYVNETEFLEGKRDEVYSLALAEFQGPRFELLNGTRQEGSVQFNVGDNMTNHVAFTNKAAFLNTQASYQTLPITGFTPENIKHLTCTIVSAGPVDAEVKAIMDVWDSMEWITVNYVTAHPASVLKF